MTNSPWPFVWRWYVVVLKCLMCRHTLAGAKNCNTNCSPFCLSKPVGIPNFMSKVPLNRVAAFFEAALLIGIPLVRLVCWSVKTITGGFLDFDLNNGTKTSTTPNSGVKWVEKYLTFLWRFLVPCAVLDWHSATVLNASVGECNQ